MAIRILSTREVPAEEPYHIRSRVADLEAERDELRSRIATLEAERDALRARVEIAERIVPVAESYRVALQAIKDSDHSPRCRWKRQHAGRALRVACDCHCMMAHRALDGAS